MKKSSYLLCASGFLFMATIMLVIMPSCNRKPPRGTVCIGTEQEDSLSVETTAELAEKAHTDEELTFWSDYPADILATEIVSRMSDEDLLAQLFMFGWAGAEPSKLVTYWVEQRHIGSIKIFGWNTDDVTRVASNITTLQNLALAPPFQIPLYVATDQEGGWIRHVKGTTSDTPGNLAIGAGGYPSDAYYSGYYIARELRALGINMNFAPAVDLYTDHSSTVIGPRSFGEDSQMTAVLGASFAAGSIAAGVIPTAKHFPGHGDTGLDSHGQLPVINIDRNVLNNRELIPFKYLIAENIPAIMSGHLAFPKVTGKAEPASLSKTFLQDILRKQLQFKGLIISDDMMMNGATTFAGDVSAAFTLAIEAGNNILCSSTTPQINHELWQNNLERMKNNPDFRKSVVSSAEHVIHSKLEYFKGKNAVPVKPDISVIPESVPDPEGTAFFTEQACRSITLYKDDLFPLTHENGGKILLAAQFQNFFDEGVKRFPKSDCFFFKYAPESAELSQYAASLRNVAKNYDTVVILVMNQAGVRLASELASEGIHTVIISALTPVPVMTGFDWADTILLCYSYSPYSFKAVFTALAGDYKLQGVLPLSLD